MCYKGVANSSIKLCLASTGTPHPARQLFRTLLFIRTEKLSSATVAKCPPQVELWSAKDMGQGFKDTFCFLYKFSVVPL